MKKRALKGRVMVVTGASSGIGQATAILGARRGMKVVLAARRKEKLDETVSALRAEGHEALSICCDVCCENQVKALVETSLTEFGRLDVMFANAGYGQMLGTAEYELSEHQQMFEVNYWGALRCFHAAIPIMREQGEGHLILTSSFLGKLGLPYFGPYAASKAAQSILAQSMWHELRRENIQVSAIHPIGTRTSFFEVAAEKGGHDSLSQNTPEAFTQSADHVGRCVLKCIERPRSEVWPHRLSRLMAGFMVTWPGLYQRVIRKHASKTRRELSALSQTDSTMNQLNQ